MTEQQLLIKLLEQISTRIDNNDTDSAVALSAIYQRIKSVSTINQQTVAKLNSFLELEEAVSS